MSLGRVFNMSAKSALLSYCVWSLSKAQSGMTVSAAQSRSIRRLIAYSLLRRELLRRTLKRREQRRLLRAASTPHQHRHREAHDDLHQDRLLRAASTPHQHRLLRAASTPHQHRHREAHDDLHQDLHDRHNAHDLHNLHEDLDDEEVQPPRGVDKQQQTLESDTWSDSGDDRDMLRLLLTEKEPDSFGYFGLFVAARLREVDPHYRGPAMVKIMQLLNSYAVDEDEFQGASPSPVQRDCTYTGMDGDKVHGASPSPVRRDSPQQDSNKGFCFVASISHNSFDDESNATHDSVEELFDEAIPDDELDTTHNASHDDLHDTSPNDLGAPQDDLQHASQDVQADAVPDVPKVAPQDRLQDTLHESSQDDSQCASLGDYLDSFHDAAQDARDL